jgi:hypothetical protein
MAGRKCMKLVTTTLIVLFLTFGGTIAVIGQEPNVGLLRVSNLEHPRQVAPSAKFSIVVDVEYAVRFNATVKSALYENSLNHLGSKLWESEPVHLMGGGDWILTVNLTAPSADREWSLTVFAYYFDSGKWNYYNDSYRGPGFTETTIKVAKLAELEVDLGTPNIPITIDNSTQSTSATGQLKQQLPVGEYYFITVPPLLQYENSTRLVFLGWQDGAGSSQRTLKLDGDLKIVGAYKTQYLLRVSSAVSRYANSSWYDAASSVVLRVDPIVPMDWPLGSIGMRYVFKGWTGAIQSGSAEINITIDGPKVVTADFTLDYASLVVPMIVVAGILGGIALAVVRRRARLPSPIAEEVTGEASISRTCEKCGKPVEEGWAHCVHCGEALAPSESVDT